MRRLLALALAATTWWMTVPPALAAEEVGVSLDGVTWTSTTTDPLFDPDVRWVPGDVRTESFFVRNQSADPALLSIRVVSGEVVDLMETGDLTVGVRSPGGAWSDVSSPGTFEVVSDAPVAPGSVVEIQVSVAFDWSSPNQTQRLATQLRFVASLRQGAVAADVGEEPRRGGIAWTGSDLPLLLALVGSFLVTLGVLLARRSRRTVADG